MTNNGGSAISPWQLTFTFPAAGEEVQSGRQGKAGTSQVTPGRTGAQDLHGHLAAGRFVHRAPYAARPSAPDQPDEPEPAAEDQSRP